MNRYARPENIGHPVRDPNLRHHYVYRAFNLAGELLYIGCTLNPEKRMVEHKTASDWYPQAARYKLAGPYNYETARQMEREAINSERSLYNYSPERRLWKRKTDAYIVAATVLLASARGANPTDLLSEAVERAHMVSRYPGNRAPIRFDDTTVPAAIRRMRDDLDTLRREALEGVPA